MLNKVILIGKIAENFAYSHSLRNGKKFFRTLIDIKRTNVTEDFVSVVIPEELTETVENGDHVYINGEFRSLKTSDGSDHFVLVQEIHKVDSPDYNGATFGGVVAIKPQFRITPKGKEVADFSLMIERSYGRRVYVPCVAWKNDAIYASKLSIGAKVSIMGRIQSRLYQKDGKEKLINELTVTHIEEIKENEECIS